MAGVNKVILVGHLGKDPEVRALDNGTKVARFSVATTESYKDRNTGERVDNTEWHNVTLWRGLAEVAENYLKKGQLVYIEGKLQTRSYEQDGVTKYATDVVGREMTMLGKRGDNNEEYQAPSSPSAVAEPKSSESNTSNSFEAEADDLPF